MSEHGSARARLEHIRSLADARLDQPLRIMNVCGGHERTITESGLRSLLPKTIELIPGPGCPVCVCPEEAIRHAIGLATQAGCLVASFGDMLNVPINGPRSAPRSLQQARATAREQVGDVRPVASPLEVLELARRFPDRQVVFFAAGFETTTAPLAAMIEAGLPDNLFLLTATRQTWPAVAMLLADGQPGSRPLDALIAPGHVATIMGAEQWRFVVDRHGLPTAVAGFTAESILDAIAAVLEQHLENRPALTNCYPDVVRHEGNPRARALLERHFDVTDAHWRGIGTLPDSGLSLNAHLDAHNAERIFPLEAQDHPRAGQMPPGCACADVVLGRVRPHECPLYGEGCRPDNPVGPCMVSDEGACRIWWSAGIQSPA
ncbi:MAG: hydrogenase formation protein HypD [Halothiobacillaceae bacterium]